jgi:hypothetical protein
LEEEDDPRLDYDEDSPVESIPFLVDRPLDKVDTMFEDMASLKQNLQELVSSLNKPSDTPESSSMKKRRLGRTPSPVAKKPRSDVLPVVDTVPTADCQSLTGDPSASPVRESSSSSSVFRNAIALFGSRKRSSVALVDVSNSPTRPGEEVRSSLAAMPLHPLVKDWFSLVSTKLDDPVVKQGTPLEPSFLKLSDKVFGRQGPDYKAMTKPREFPPRFHEISTLKDQDQVKSKISAQRSLSQAQIKSSDRLARVGVAASSYSHHLLQAARLELADCRNIEGENSRLTNRLDAMVSFLDAAVFVALFS